MLIHLNVENFALVTQLELEFAAGMTVVTGETGAGKSIILDALGLALGDRADTGLIAADASRAEIHATFDTRDNPQALAWLAERDLPGADTGECILRRVMGKDGRSRGYINGAPSTVGDLKTLGDMLIDIHSQHEHQSLLKRDTHQRLLDEYGGLLNQASQVRLLSEHYHTAQKQLAALMADSQEKTARLQLLTYQVEEFDTLAIGAAEHLGLEDEQQRLSRADDILAHCATALQLCSGEDSDNEHSAALGQLSQALQALQSIPLESLAPIIELFDSSRIQLEEAIADLNRFAEGVELDPARLKTVEARLSEIYEVARKHRIEPAEIPAFAERLRAELASLSHADEDIEGLRDNAQQLKADYAAAAGKLSQARSKAAKKLGTQVGKQLASLGMGDARFEVALTPTAADSVAANGLENLEFLISTNPGQAPRALNKIASGGELSRISLAIQVITANTSKVPTLVFDEVDVGIGGAIAEVVGSLLRQLGEQAQIVCVTHLPQVAAQGHQHYQVSKSRDGARASTRIEPLAEDAKITEIARMLGGVDLTKQSLAHAQDMYWNAQAAHG